MTAKYIDDYAVLQSGFWKLEIDTLNPRVVSLRVDEQGVGEYGTEMLVEGLGGLSVSETKEGLFNCRRSTGHSTEASLNDEIVLNIKDIKVGDFALLDIRFSLDGQKGEILRLEVNRRITRDVEFITDVPFGFHFRRLFSLWSRPDLRFCHSPDEGFQKDYSPLEEKRKRRVIGYHSADEQDEFVVHSIASFPDFAQKIDNGFHHIEQRYCRYALIGISSRDFKDGPVKFAKGDQENWVMEFRLIPQGTLAPVSHESPNLRVNEFVRGFFDGYMLSSVSADHEYFGNNPYRHCFAPCAMMFNAKGFMVTDRPGWSEKQGNIDLRWEHQIRRTLASGRINPERLAILFDSGIWQDVCGMSSKDVGAPGTNAFFVLGCCYRILKTGNIKFAREIYKDLDALLRWLIDKQSDEHDGLIINPIPGTKGCPISWYNDCLSIGHMDMYHNVAAYDAFQKFAGLLEFIGEDKISGEYKQRAARIKDAVNKYLWDDEKGCYVGWIDVEGETHNSWYTDINFYAFSAGLVPDDRAEKMLKSFMGHPNHDLMFAAGLCLDPIDEGSIHHQLPFGQWLHGGMLLALAAEEIIFRARAGGGECAWEMLDKLISQWEQDHLCKEPIFQDWMSEHPYCFEPWQKHTGKNAYSWTRGGKKGIFGVGTEPYLADGGSMLWAFYTGVYGICPDFIGITFTPHIPKELADTKIKIRLMGKLLNIEYVNYGDFVKSIEVDGNVYSAESRISWQDISSEAKVKIICAM